VSGGSPATRGSWRPTSAGAAAPKRLTLYRRGLGLPLGYPDLPRDEVIHPLSAFPLEMVSPDHGDHRCHAHPEHDSGLRKSERRKKPGLHLRGWLYDHG
jgi:hypothetical protein